MAAATTRDADALSARRGQWLTIAAYVSLATLTTLPALAKHGPRPAPAAIVYVCLLLGAGVWLMQADIGALDRRADGYAVSRWLWLWPCIALAMANAVLYPGTRIVPAPSSAPDALIEPARRLLGGVYPYASPLWSGAPISPGPGWIVVHAPLTLSGLIWLVVPLHLGLAGYMVSRLAGPFSAAAFCTALLALPPFLQMSLVGHDLFAVSCACVVVTLGVYEWTLDSARSHRSRWWLAWGIATGVVATARVPLVMLVPLLAVLVARSDARGAVKFAAVAGGVAAAWHLPFFLWGRALGVAYQPLHVFGRAGRAGLPAILMGLLLAAIATVLLWRRGAHHAGDWLLLLWTTVGIPFAAVGLGELSNLDQIKWSDWEGKIYASFGLPVLLAALFCQASSRYRTG